MYQIYMRSANMVARRIGDELILVPIRNNAGDLRCVYSLNEVAAFLWERIDGRRSDADLLGILCSEYQVSTDEAGNDLQEFLRQMESIGALTRH